MREADAPSDFHKTITDLGGAALADRLRFVTEIDKLKGILRQTPLLDRSRKENDAEHSWHLAMMACVLADYAAVEVDMLRVIRMLLIHDIVEIDAGDTFLYDTSAADAQEEKEQAAADRQPFQIANAWDVITHPQNEHQDQAQHEGKGDIVVCQLAVIRERTENLWTDDRLQEITPVQNVEAG